MLSGGFAQQWLDCINDRRFMSLGCQPILAVEQAQNDYSRPQGGYYFFTIK